MHFMPPQNILNTFIWIYLKKLKVQVLNLGPYLYWDFSHWVTYIFPIVSHPKHLLGRVAYKGSPCLTTLQSWNADQLIHYYQCPFYYYCVPFSVWLIEEVQSYISQSSHINYTDNLLLTRPLPFFTVTINLIFACGLALHWRNNADP